MKFVIIQLLLLQFLVTPFADAQKTISEGILHYNISISQAGQENNTQKLDGASATVYIKGSLTRYETTSSLGSEATVHDGKTGNAFILKEYSGQKLMITLTRENWMARNKHNENIVFETLPGNQLIDGFNCKKATAKLNDGTLVTAFYIQDTLLNNRDFDVIFKNLPGLPVQYELQKGKLSFTYTLNKIESVIIPSVKFEAPKTGYRVMTYEENQQGKSE